MFKKLIFTFLIVFGMAQGGWGTNYYVDGAKSDDNADGTSWANAKKPSTPESLSWVTVIP